MGDTYTPQYYHGWDSSILLGFGMPQKEIPPLEKAEARIAALEKELESSREWGNKMCDERREIHEAFFGYEIAAHDQIMEKVKAAVALAQNLKVLLVEPDPDDY